MANERKITVDTKYGVEQIDSLEGLEAVRKRPGMYIGSTSQKGVTHLVWECADNSFDEFTAGFGKRISIYVEKDGTITVTDQGRGVPVGPHHKWKNSDGTSMDTLTGLMTKLHSGGKFNKEDSAYKASAGLHGVGVKAVNALSDKFSVIVKRDGKIYQQDFSRGNPTTTVKIVGTCIPSDTGTIFRYHPDPEIFKLTLLPNCKDLQARIDELASLNGGIMVEYTNEATGFHHIYHYEDGIIGYTKRMVEDKKTLYDDPIYLRGNYELSKDRVIMVEVAFIHDDEEKPNQTIKTFANNINTYEGGFHLQGFRNEYKRQFNKFAQDNKLTDDTIELNYLLDGIYAIISIKVPEAEFEGQTKTKLGNAEAQTAVEEVMKKGFEKILKDKNYFPILEALVSRAIKVKEAEEAARRARSMARKANKTTKMALPGKLADCANKSGYSELFLVEGDSAAGSAKTGRYREFQAILPLRGKVLNTEKADFERMINSDAIKNIIAALGAGVGEHFDVTKVRYDKVVIMTDADDDGSHIRALLLTFFYNYMRSLFEHEMVYITMPPLYRVEKSKQIFYLRDDHELREFKKKHGTKITVNRFKGLGEMNADQLKETTMDPATRILKRVSMSDMERAVEVFNICMGTQADLRREFIEANAHKVNLDFE